MRNIMHIGKPNKKGFTLVELCVVMAVVALVAAMITTFMMMFNNRSKMLDKEYAVVGNIADVQSAVDEWLHTYDNAEYSIETNASGALVAYKVTINRRALSVDLAYTKSSSVYAALRYSSGVLYWEENGRTKKSYEISEIDGVSFNADERIVTADMNYGEGETQRVMFAIFSHVTRTRYASDRRQGR